MRRTLVCALLLFCVAAPSASAGPPAQGALVPGRSLGGVRLGATEREVRALLGGDYGVCKGCATTTWYYTYQPFTRQGLAVELKRGRVSAVWTIWRPAGWSAPNGLRLGAPRGQVTELAGPLVPFVCANYEVLTHDRRGVRTAYFIVDGSLWAFGLFRPSDTPCR